MNWPMAMSMDPAGMRMAEWAKSFRAKAGAGQLSDSIHRQPLLHRCNANTSSTSRFEELGVAAVDAGNSVKHLQGGHMRWRHVAVACEFDQRFADQRVVIATHRRE